MIIEIIGITGKTTLLNKIVEANPGKFENIIYTSHIHLLDEVVLNTDIIF